MTTMSAQLKNYEKQDMQVGDAHADDPRQSEVRGIDKMRSIRAIDWDRVS